MKMGNSFKVAKKILDATDTPVNSSEETDSEEDTYKKKFCCRCGRSGHYANTCFAKTNKHGKPISLMCTRCGREGHLERDCYAKTDVFKNKLE